LQEVDGGYDWLPSALDDLSENKLLKQAFNKAAASDYFYDNNKLKPRARFPYSLAALRVVKYIVFDYERLSDMWEPQHVAAKRTEELIRRFVELGHTEYAKVYDRISERYDKDELIMIDILDEKMNAKEFSLVGCHPSEYGHRIIAAAVYRELEKRSLLPKE